MQRFIFFLATIAVTTVLAGCLASSPRVRDSVRPPRRTSALFPELPADKLTVTDGLSAPEKELIVETGEWKVVFSLFYNGGVYQLFDKAYDCDQTDNLVTGSGYTQGGIFDYNVYLSPGGQEFTTTCGRNPNPGRASLEILENTPVRLRVRQICHPRINNGNGPPNDRYVELDMVQTTTDWTFYPTGRVNIKFDAVVPPAWNGTVSSGPGGAGAGIDADGTTITAVNGADFNSPWVTYGDTIESVSGKWGPIEIAFRRGGKSLRLTAGVPKGRALDFVIKRTHIHKETISIHADGDAGKPPHQSRWQGGTNGCPLFSQPSSGGGLSRGGESAVSADYVIAHWARPPRAFGSLLAFNEPWRSANFGSFDDTTWGDLSFTQNGWSEPRAFTEIHRHFMAQLGSEAGWVLPRLKSIQDSLPFADDYRRPYAEARAGALGSGAGISKYGFDLASGAYVIAADETKTAAIAFDSSRGKTLLFPLAYWNPAVMVTGFDVPDERVKVDLSRDNGATFQPLAASQYNLTGHADSAQLGGADRRLLQLLCDVPAEAHGDKTWVLRLREEEPVP